MPSARLRPHRNRPQWRPAAEGAQAALGNRQGQYRPLFRLALRPSPGLKKPREVAIQRQEKAEALGLTYEEYSLEIMERGYYPQPEHAEAIKAKRAQRRKDGGVVGQSLKGMKLS